MARGLDVLAVGANVTIEAEQKEAAAFVIDVAEGRIDKLAEIAEWLQTRMVEYR